MNREFQTRFTAVLLLLLTAAAMVFAWINFQKERDYQVPTDGVWWIEQGGHLVARQVEAAGPGSKAGIKPGDQLLAVAQQDVTDVRGLNRQLYRAGVWSKATYSLVRQNVPVDAVLVLVPADRSIKSWERLIALIYLGIGLYILLRRWTATGSLHFYVFCLVSFILYSFHYTGKLNDFDWLMYWGNVVAMLLQPAIFLHFSLTFPEKREVVRKYPWTTAWVYVPAAVLLAIQIIALRRLVASEELSRNLDRLQTGYLALFFLCAAWIMQRTYHSAKTGVLRQQMKWVTRGTILSIGPYTLFYVLPYLIPGLREVIPTALMNGSVLSLALLPLMFGYAIFRYRLMDVDLIFKRGVVYTLSAAAIVVVYFGVVVGVSVLIHARVPNTGTTGLAVAIVVTALLFDPVKSWIQEQLDQLFYRTRYDYRRTLVEFGRELSSETDLDKMLSSVVDRLSHTLLVDRLAIFLATADTPSRFALAKSFGISQTAGLDLSFLNKPQPENLAGHVFFENTHLVPRETQLAQESIARLELNYYIPCVVQQRTIAVLGLGKTVEGDFLSSEDVALLETLAGYIGIAIQNARLYASLEQKVSEYERLKDFN